MFLHHLVKQLTLFIFHLVIIEMQTLDQWLLNGCLCNNIHIVGRGATNTCEDWSEVLKWSTIAERNLVMQINEKDGTVAQM